MKRSSGEMESNITSMAKCLMLLSRGVEETEMLRSTTRPSSVLGRVFECKTCNRQFSSFQALGGHRASHKKPKLMEGSELQMTQLMNTTQVKPKTHECSICGLEFSIGQALGGHMRRHRANNVGGDHQVNNLSSSSSPNSSSSSILLPPAPHKVPVLMRSNSSRRVLCLDLNLSPPENDLEVPLGSVGFAEKNSAPTPMVHCFI